MKVKDLIKELEDLDGDLEVKMKIHIEDGFYDVPSKSESSGVKSVYEWIGVAVLEGRK